MIRPNLFQSTQRRRPTLTGNARTEIDLRKEFDTLIFGDANNIPHGKKILIRSMRRDADGYATKCVCLEASNTTEPDPDCSYCLGEGYLWDEYWEYAYTVHVNADSGLARKYIHVAPGLQRADYLVFYIRYDSSIKYEDKIIEIKLDLEGAPVIPYIRKNIYKPSTIIELRSDYGRVEFLAVFCKEEDAIRAD